MAKPIISLLTDLGAFDHYVGVMKAVIWNINPTVQIVDLCHEINAFDIVEAAFKLECSYRYFPNRSVHVVVVDPGVGSPRRPILAVGDTQYYIGPDNGVFSWVMQSDNVHVVYELNATHYFAETISKTFHGRDIFVPCAANLLKTMEPSNFGDEITDYRRFKVPVAVVEAGKQIQGKVISIDHFGNCITNISAEDMTTLAADLDQARVNLQFEQTRISGLSDYYGQSESRNPLAIVGNAGYIEIAINKGSAARELNVRKNMDVLLTIG